jgi:demethylmenaquinone methyltransferase/2-methoxy-6-polyprenyl-1,4-benzoquinol methylase
MAGERERRSYAQRLSIVSRLTEPLARRAIAALAPEPGSRGLDAGCGIGTDTVLLAEAVGPGGHVTGLDLSPDFLARAADSAAARGVADRTDWVEGDLARVPLADRSVDWIWCADALWPGPAGLGFPKPEAVVAELARVLRPGGRLALFYWAGQTLLPGYPELEARLRLAFAKNTFYLKRRKPQQHFVRALNWLQAAGLTGGRAAAFATAAHAPFTGEMREAVDQTIRMVFGELVEHVNAADARLLARLIDPGSPDYLPANPDYCCLVHYVLFLADRPA